MKVFIKRYWNNTISSLGLPRQVKCTINCLQISKAFDVNVLSSQGGVRTFNISCAESNVNEVKFCLSSSAFDLAYEKFDV